MRIRNDWPLVFASVNEYLLEERAGSFASDSVAWRSFKDWPIPMPPSPSLRGRFGRRIRFALRLIQETRNGTFIRGSPMPAVIEKPVGAEIVMRSQRASLRRFLHGLSFSVPFSILGNEPIRF